MLHKWRPLKPEDSLSILDADQANRIVRLYATERVSTMPDDELVLFMLQLL